MCKRWVRAGHDVQVITCAPNAPAGKVYDGYRNRMWAREQIDGIEVLRVWTYIAANKGRLRRGLNFLSFLITATLAGLFVKRPDVVIATSPQFFCGLAGTCVSKLRGLPFLLEIRDIWPASIAAVGAMKKRVLLRLLEVLERLMYRSATRIVTVGDGYREELAGRGVDRERVDVVTNGVDREIFEASADGSAVRRKCQLDGNFVCSYVGTIGMACGLDVVLRAAQILSARGRTDVKFMLVGDGAVREELEGRVRAEGLSNVQFTGRVDKADVPAYLAASDACLVHLRREKLFKTVLPSKMFEAWAMGKPIVLGVEGFAANLLHQAAGGVCIEPENAEQLAHAVERLADDRAWGRRLGDAGRRHVLRHFDRDELSNDYLAVIRQTCEVQAEQAAPAAALLSVSSGAWEERSRLAMSAKS
jgi:glycosyltransferase involved in cell wall biosynthesis